MKKKTIIKILTVVLISLFAFNNPLFTIAYNDYITRNEIKVISDEGYYDDIAPYSMYESCNSVTTPEGLTLETSLLPISLTNGGGLVIKHNEFK